MIKKEEKKMLNISNSVTVGNNIRINIIHIMYHEVMESID